LFKGFDLGVRSGADDFLDFFVEKDPIDELDFIIDPVASFFVEGLDDFIVFFLTALMIILK
jgi:hypothetical protein